MEVVLYVSAEQFALLGSENVQSVHGLKPDVLSDRSARTVPDFCCPVGKYSDVISVVCSQCIVFEGTQGNPEAGKFEAVFRKECPADLSNSGNAFSAERVHRS
ncbi:hypothetical protein D3C86_1433850 [compost metagenome]